MVVFLDGDYGDRPSELPLLLAPVIDGRADITMGSRLGTARNSGAMAWHSAFGNRLAAGLLRLLYGLQISDLGVANDLIQLGRDRRLAHGKAPRTAAWFGEWQEAVADLERRSGAR